MSKIRQSDRPRHRQGRSLCDNGLKGHQPGKDVLIDTMAETVTVEGTLVKKGGIRVIYVPSVKGT